MRVREILRFTMRGLYASDHVSSRYGIYDVWRLARTVIGNGISILSDVVVSWLK